MIAASIWLKRGWKLKLISFGLAIGLWYYAVNEESVEITRVIPLEVKVENENISVMKMSTNSLRVTMKAPRNLISEVAAADIRALHSFGKELEKAGEYSFHTDPSEITLPLLGLHVIKIEPPIVQVVVDETVTQKLPVKPDFQGEPAFGYKVRDEEIQMDPDSVMVKGPKGEVEKTGFVLTRPINLTGRTRSFRITTEFQPHESIQVKSAEKVTLSIPIYEVSEEKQIENVQVKMIRPSGSLGIAELNPQKVSVTLQGPERVLQNLEADKMHAYADLSGLDYGDHEVEIMWVLPTGVTIKDDQRTKVAAVIRREH